MGLCSGADPSGLCYLTMWGACTKKRRYSEPGRESKKDKEEREGGRERGKERGRKGEREGHREKERREEVEGRRRRGRCP